MPSCTTGGQCYGCSSALPGLSDPFLDDPLPPKPTALPAQEVRRTLPAQIQAAAAGPASAPASPPHVSPYKIISPSHVTAPASKPPSAVRPASGRQPAGQSVLRRASNEEEIREPARHTIDRRQAAPIIRSQSPEEIQSFGVPANPLRR